MVLPYTYQTINTECIAEFKDKGSKFIGYSLMIETTEEFKQKLKIIKELHPKATHHCFAYRLGISNNNYRASDNGEPNGTAGKPILGTIDSLQLTNTLVVVVRYYGGTMLGVPGLINAYKTTAKLALENCVVVTKEQTKLAELEFDYNLTAIVAQSLAKIQATDLQTENLLFCKKLVNIPVSKIQIATEIFDKIHNLAVKWLD
jgi:uncharacterized YigZ family protein